MSDKTRTKLYIAGPMRGLPMFNFPKFDQVAKHVSLCGFEPINPAQLDRERNPDIENTPGFALGDMTQLEAHGFDWHRVIGQDLIEVICADGIVMLPGWENSIGANHEHYVAVATGKEVYFWEEHGDLPFLNLTKTDPEKLRSNPPALPGGVWADHPAVPDLPTPPQGQVWTEQVQKNTERIGAFTTKDSGERKAFESGMVRDTDAGKPRYDLVPVGPYKRLAELYARGAEKYGDRNWQKADSFAELHRFMASAERHFMQWKAGEVDEDHAIAVVWNIFATLWLREKLGLDPYAPLPEEGS